ncbi:polysaccharide biosynthesis protein [Metabacillus rhizolycopersici]|uniref:Polysaccharide biosynthesis protein n=1 Tax=Metabacillus rhizolycopersici TaxID=2875709 RepID=A0ABS7UUM1_9BACI|nr:polysaccharide biosynthesis protein [Metabacillus rhizolycopersici]MBZ5751978.1 polysaccharide biosynthesis protein [Metabacillus rhizolycopersici]
MVDQTKLKNYFKDQNILVTGGTGSIGQCIVSSLIDFQPKKIIIFSKDDSKQYLMKQQYHKHKNIFFHLGNIREYESVEYVTRGIDLVFHVAALKQVPVCEDHPFEAVKTNVIGSENVIKACILNKVKKVVNISTDKAVNPTNTMGATKLISEKLFNNANSMLNNYHTKFCSVRFGNVLNSRGSVIPLFMNQARSGNALTVTNPMMTRFIMSISDAAQLTLKSAFYSNGGETFIFKMKSLNILTLAESIQNFFEKKGLTAPTIKQIGIRPGEKLYEELIYAHEFEHIVEDDELYVILPKSGIDFFHFKYNSNPFYRSDQVELMKEDDIVNILTKLEQGVL